MYVVAMSKDSSGGYHQRLHALNLATGAELFGGPTEIQATYPTAGGGTTQFDPAPIRIARALLLNGEIYTTWASHCDDDPYTGWMIAYSGSTLARTRVFNIAPNSGGFGPAIWMGAARRRSIARTISTFWRRTEYSKPRWMPTVFRTCRTTAIPS